MVWTSSFPYKHSKITAGKRIKLKLDNSTKKKEEKELKISGPRVGTETQQQAIDKRIMLFTTRDSIKRYKNDPHSRHLAYGKALTAEQKSLLKIALPFKREERCSVSFVVTT